MLHSDIDQLLEACRQARVRLKSIYRSHTTKIRSRIKVKRKMICSTELEKAAEAPPRLRLEVSLPSQDLLSQCLPVISQPVDDDAAHDSIITCSTIMGALAVAVVVNANAVPCNIENAPADILFLIMMALPSLEALWNLIRASPACRRTFDSMGGLIIKHLLENDELMSPQAFHYAHVAAAVRTGKLSEYMPSLKVFKICLSLPIDIFNDKDVKEIYSSMSAEDLHLFILTACHIRQAARVCMAFPRSTWRFSSDGDMSATSIVGRIFSCLMGPRTWETHTTIRGFCPSRDCAKVEWEDQVSDQKRTDIPRGWHPPTREWSAEQRAVLSCWRMQLLQEVYQAAAERKLGWTNVDHRNAMSPNALNYEVFLRDRELPGYIWQRVAIHNAHIRRELELVVEYINQRFGWDVYSQRHFRRLLPMDPADENMPQMSWSKMSRVRTAWLAIIQMPLVRRLVLGNVPFDDLIMSGLELMYNGCALLLPESAFAGQDWPYIEPEPDTELDMSDRELGG